MPVTALDRVTVEGHTSRGFEPVREAFADNFAQRGELGGACCAYLRGEKVVLRLTFEAMNPRSKIVRALRGSDFPPDEQRGRSETRSTPFCGSNRRVDSSWPAPSHSVFVRSAVESASTAVQRRPMTPAGSRGSVFHACAARGDATWNDSSGSVLQGRPGPAPGT